MSRLHPDAVKHQVRLRLDELRKLTYHELVKLPEWTTVDVRFGHSVAKITTYRDGSTGERLSIAVQCRPEGSTGGLIWRGVYAEGFHIAPDGTISDMPDWERLGGYM